MRCDVTTWRLQVNEQRWYRRWAHSLVDPIGRRGNPRPCAVCAHRRARESLQPSPPTFTPFAQLRESLSFSPFRYSPLYPFFLSYLSFPLPFYIRCSGNVIVLITRAWTHPHMYAHVYRFSRASYTDSQVKTSGLHSYLCNDECLRDGSPPPPPPPRDITLPFSLPPKFIGACLHTLSRSI